MKKSAHFLNSLAGFAGLVALLFTPGPAGAAEPRVTFHNSVSALPAPVAATQRAVLAVKQADTMEFGVSMQLRNYPQMQARIARGEIISRSELERVYLPLQSDYDAVVKWLVSEGFTITQHDPSRLVVYARGSLAQVQKSLQTHLVTVTANGGIDYPAADTPPSLPLSIATPVLGINHLQPFHQHHKHAVKLPLTNNAPPFKVSEILAAYNGTNLGVTGANQKIAILIDTVAKNSDLTAFWSANNIAQTTGNIETVNVNSLSLPAASGEETLDEEWSSGVAPGAKIRVYASGTLDDANLDKALQRIINDLPTQPQIHQLSISLGLGETYGTQAQFNTDAQLFATLASGGVSIFVSSGDGGSTPDSSGGTTGPLQVEHYASDPNVTAVGGTALTVNSSTGARTSEVVWGSNGGGTGGGVSVIFAKPSWQTGTGVPAGSFRFVPDVCLVADPNTGAYVYLNGAVAQYGGTSWSAPSWAGYCALVNEARANAGKGPIGLLNPSVYPLIGTNNFFDITSGSNNLNTAKSGGKYSATVGYDETTGVGAPHMANLLATLVGQAAPAPTITSFTPTSGVQNTSVVITGANFGSASAVKFNGTTATFTVNSATQITATSPAGATTGTLSVTTPSGTATSAASFTVVAGAPAPTIAGFSPAYALPGSSVVITGTNLTAATAVTFNSVAASAFTVNSATQITATVPASATNGPVAVTTASGTATSSTSFVVLTGNGTPTIASFSPSSGGANTTVTISGTNFVNLASVTFGGTAAASPTIVSTTQITALVPAGAATGPIVVTTGLGTATSAGSFTVTATVTPVVLASWDVSGQTSYGTSPLTATVAAANVTVGGLTRGSGVTTAGSAAARAWGGNGFDTTSEAAAVAANDYVSFTIKGNTGYNTSLSSISRWDYRRSSGGATSGVLQYQVGAGSFTDIATVSYTSSGSAGASLAAVDLTTVNALQNIAAGTTVTLRIVNFGASSSGGNWYLYDVANSTAADLELSGTALPASASTPNLTIAKAHTGSFTQGDTGRVYTITATNGGTAATSGTVTVTDTLPTGLTVTALSGTGWTTNLNNLTATRSDALAAGSSYPPLTVTVNVATTAAGSLTNVASVSGGGETNTADDTASDPTTIIALTPSQSWRLQWFGDASATGAGADTAIAANDGIPNLLKYALGLVPPTTPTSTSSVVTIDETTGFLRLTATKNPAATDLSFTIEGTATLGDPNSWTTAGIIIDQNTGSTLQGHDPTPLSSGPRYIRLTVKRP